ncbi:MAG TPA: hypothetical protein VM764_03890 [Gemmatimonadaceae bacterium]|jgi:hypothetical protein|nr:hypothetical protein [Gemmatimonadaceae bacterium]
MRKGINKLAFLGLTIAAATAATTNGARAYDGAPAVSACEITAKDTLRIRSGTQDYTVMTSDSLADPVTASFDMASKITVSNVVREAATNTHRLTLDASEAVPGDWKLTLRSGMTECTGNVTVAASADTAR